MHCRLAQAKTDIYTCSFFTNSYYYLLLNNSFYIATQQTGIYTRTTAKNKHKYGFL
ncbi:hypothetical protein FLA_1640 [Filimonas lacunae]|nr:hypothetical protein FLA_1640 [Filimonas lacunae]